VSWTARLRGDPLPWLLDDAEPPVRHLALQALLDRPADDPEVKTARRMAMRARPIADILAAQQPPGYWGKPGPGYTAKYRGTVWQLIFLDQLGADPDDARVRAACAHVLAHGQAVSGGFAAWGPLGAAPPPAARVIHCLNGNVLRALLGFGWLDDPRVQRAIAWQAAAITGQGSPAYAGFTPGPGFRCVANGGQPCAWGAIKALLALARVPVARRGPLVRQAVEEGAAFLLSTDPATARYPTRIANARPSPAWFKLGFPSAYVADVLQTLETLVELGYADDARLQPALEWLVSRQDDLGRWRNEYAYNGRTWVDVDRQGQPSKWVTLRACRVLKLACG
jgi:hypothetical protein